MGNNLTTEKVKPTHQSSCNFSRQQLRLIKVLGNGLRQAHKCDRV